MCGAGGARPLVGDLGVFQLKNLEIKMSHMRFPGIWEHNTKPECQLKIAKKRLKNLLKRLSLKNVTLGLKSDLLFHGRGSVAVYKEHSYQMRKPPLGLTNLC